MVGGVDRPILKNFVLLPSPPPITRAWLLSMIDNDHARVVGGGCLLSTVVSIVLHYYGLGQVLKKRYVGLLAVQHNKTTSGAPGGGVWKFFSSPGVNDHHARIVRGGDGQGEGGGAPGGGVWKFFTSFNEETRSTAPRAPLICPSLNLYQSLC